MGAGTLASPASTPLPSVGGGIVFSRENKHGVAKREYDRRRRAFPGRLPSKGDLLIVSDQG